MANYKQVPLIGGIPIIGDIANLGFNIITMPIDLVWNTAQSLWGGLEGAIGWARNGATVGAVGGGLLAAADAANKGGDVGGALLDGVLKGAGAGAVLAGGAGFVVDGGQGLIQTAQVAASNSMQIASSIVPSMDTPNKKPPPQSGRA